MTEESTQRNGRECPDCGEIKHHFFSQRQLTIYHISESAGGDVEPKRMVCGDCAIKLGLPVIKEEKYGTGDEPTVKFTLMEK